MGEVLRLGVRDQLETGGLRQEEEPAELAGTEALRRRLLRLAFDVHDGPMQDLIAITWRLQSARERALREAEAGEMSALSAMLEDLAGDLGGVEQGLRSLMFSLEDNALPSDSLRARIGEHVATFEGHASARVKLSVTGDVEPRTDSQRIALERVLRESLSNIAKHAHAEHVTVTLRGTDEYIALEIRDDGCGFPADADNGARHIGIRAMRERVALLDGEFSIASRRGGPTVVTARILKWRAAGDVRPVNGSACA